MLLLKDCARLSNRSHRMNRGAPALLRGLPVAAQAAERAGAAQRLAGCLPEGWWPLLTPFSARQAALGGPRATGRPAARLSHGVLPWPPHTPGGLFAGIATSTLAQLARRVRANSAIHAQQLRVTLPDGSEQVMSRSEALGAAQAVGKDLVEVDASASPPAARIMDLQLHLYHLQQAEEAQKKGERLNAKLNAPKEVGAGRGRGGGGGRGSPRCGGRVGAGVRGPSRQQRACRRCMRPARMPACMSQASAAAVASGRAAARALCVFAGYPPFPWSADSPGRQDLGA